MSVADGDYWFAIEYAADGSGDSPGLRLQHRDPNDDSPSDGYVGVTRVIQGSGELTNAQMYPTALTWPGTAFVLVQGVEDVNQDEPHLVLYTQDRDALLTTGPSNEEAPSSTANGKQEAKAYAARNEVAPEQFLCWTSKDPDDDTV